MINFYFYHPLKMKPRIQIFFLLLSFTGTLYGQKNESKIDTLLSKSKRFLEINTDSSFRYAFLAAEKSQVKNSTRYLALSYRALANAFSKSDDADMTIAYFEKAFAEAEKCNDDTLRTVISFEVADAYYKKGNYDQSELQLQKAKKMADKINNKEILFNCYKQLFYIYILPINNQTDSAQKYIEASLTIAQSNNDSLKIAGIYNDYCSLYDRRHESDKAIESSLKALAIYERKQLTEGLMDSYKNLGDLYWKNKQNQKALECYEKSYEYSKQTNSNNSIALLSCDLAYMYGGEKKYELLEKYGNESYATALKTKSWRTISYVGLWLSEAYERAGKEKKSLFYYKIFHAVQDSINNRQRIEKISRSGMQSDFEEKVATMKMEEAKRQALSEEKAHNQKVVRNILIVGFLISFILLVLAYRSYVAKKKANVIIKKQKEEVEMQKQKIEVINKEITDSINYAKIIQRSILPEPKEIMKVFPECFGLYKPKSVVSGDFYWFHKALPSGSKEGLVFIAAVDCTGHGVPGALMSMIGVEKLNEAVENHLSSPPEILKHLNRGVKTTLKQKDFASVSKDGMDIALCCFDLKKNILHFAGAMRPLWIIRGKELIEYKSTKVSIGGTTSDLQEFITHDVQLQKGDSIYIFTDGYADQFGGEKGKKIMTKNFKETLLSIQQVPFLEQEKILDKKLMEWQGNFEQVDDILVIGIRI